MVVMVPGAWLILPREREAKNPQKWRVKSSAALMRKERSLAALMSRKSEELSRQPGNEGEASV